MTDITTKLAGVSYGDAQENIRTFGCRDIGSYTLAREPDNEQDPNAIRVQVGGKFMGYIPKETAKHLAPMMDAGCKFIAYFHSRNESPDHQTMGLTVRIVELDEPGGGRTYRRLTTPTAIRKGARRRAPFLFPNPADLPAPSPGPF